MLMSGSPSTIHSFRISDCCSSSVPNYIPCAQNVYTVYSLRFACPPSSRIAFFVWEKVCSLLYMVHKDFMQKILSPVLQSAMYNFHLQIKPPIKGTYAACTRWTTTSRIGFWYIPIAVQECSSRKLQLTHTFELKCNLNPANRWYVASFPCRPSFSSLAVW